MVTRHGGTRVGSLMTLLVVCAIGYFSVNIGQHYLRYYRFKDRMEQQVRFQASRPDSVIRKRLAAFADSLGLPPAAQQIRIRRAQNVLFIWADYAEIIEFPGFVKEIHFAPQAVGPY
jgi:hypothetical protein